MDYQEDLTNENVKKKFKSQFELVGYAIKLAENMIKTGRGPRIKTDTQNVAINVVDEINAGLDKFEDIPKYAHLEAEAEKNHDRKDFSKAENNGKTERKRARKILID